MLRISENLLAYYTNPISLNKRRKVEAVCLEKLDTKLNSNLEDRKSKQNFSDSNDFKEILEEETKKYR